MLRIALAQINPTVGDIRGNTGKIISYIKRAINKKVDIIAFPELALTGYPPENLINVPEFIETNIKALEKIKQVTNKIVSIVGFIARNSNNPNLYNAAAALTNRNVLDIYHKVHLPNYGVFDEKRYFTPGRLYHPFSKFSKIKVGINICEDIWVDKELIKYQIKEFKAKILINISASQFYIGNYEERYKVFSQRAKENQIYIIYVNLVGGQDGLVFDGRSIVFDPKGKIIAQAKAFKEDFLIVNIPHTAKGVNSDILPEIKPLNKVEETHEALKLGLKDYITKNNFTKAIIGLSGGIDSALTALIAVEALGKENVLGLYLPSEFSTRLSQECVISLTKNLGIKLISIPITNIYHSYLKSIKLSQSKTTLTHENLQARIRSNILMAFSNKLGSLVLSTGNKSEFSTGYATLYGDMAGGFALLKDVPKTMVYELVSFCNNYFYKNKHKYPIPLEIIKRPPTAELKPNQKDSDTLPSYEILDPILQAYIEENKDVKNIITQNNTSLKTVSEIIQMVNRSEYKRRQSPPGVKITPYNVGKSCRFPITNKFSSGISI